MLKSNSKFITMLRKDKIPSPTVRNFNTEQWTRDYNLHGTGQVEEIDVYEAGLWIGPQLKNLWGSIHDLNINQYRFDGFVSILFEIFLKNYRIITGDFQPNIIPHTSGWEDYELTALGDSLWRALNFLGGKKSQMVGNKSPGEDEVFQLLKFCGEIYGLEYFMGRVIHCGWKHECNNEAVSFGPSAPFDDFLKNEAIALNLRDDDLFEFLAVYLKQWKIGKLRDEAPIHLKLLGRTGHRASFLVVESAPESMPFTVPLFAMDIPSWMRDSLHIKSCNFDNVSVSEILSVWLFFGQAFNEINNFELAESSRLVYGCALTEIDLIGILKLFGFSKKKANAVISFLTYAWKPHEDLWSSPLVRVGNIFYPFLPAFLSPNVTRTIDLWLKKCKYKTKNGKVDEMIGPRGLAFERYVRNELKNYMEKCRYVDGFVFPEASNIVGGDIDLFWRMDNLVVVADTKFNKFPANPNEIGNYYREIEHGSEQVNARIEKLKNKRSQVAKDLQWKGPPEDLEFQPLVVCGHSFGAGLEFNGVPCIQYDMLALLFDNHEFKICAHADGMVREDDIALPFAKKQGEFIGFFRKYLAAPSTVWFRKPGLIQGYGKGANLSVGIQMRFRHWSVSIPNDAERRGYCTERLAAWEHEFIGADI
ncbi:hypothetical protein ACWYXK_12765 [Janthinobacterium lividum]